MRPAPPEVNHHPSESWSLLAESQRTLILFIHLQSPPPFTVESFHSPLCPFTGSIVGLGAAAVQPRSDCRPLCMSIHPARRLSTIPLCAAHKSWFSQHNTCHVVMGGGGVGGMGMLYTFLLISRSSVRLPFSGCLPALSSSRRPPSGPCPPTPTERPPLPTPGGPLVISPFGTTLHSMCTPGGPDFSKWVEFVC